MGVRGTPRVPDADNQIPHQFDPILMKLRAGAAEYFGTPDVSLVPSGAQHRPFSHLLRLAVCRGTDTTPMCHVFVKVFKHKVVNGDADTMRRRVIHDFDTTSRVYAAMRALPDLGAVRPVACYPEHLAIVTEQAAGVTLLDLLQERLTWFRGGADSDPLLLAMRNVGRWLRTFQAIPAPDVTVTLDELRAYLDHRLNLLRGRRMFTECDRAGVLGHFDTLGGAVSARELQAVAVHSDMSLGNVLVDGPRIVVLDFAMARTGTRLHDLTRLSFQLDLLAIKPHVRRGVVDGLQQALIEGFDPASDSGRPLFRLHLLLHRINHLLTVSAAQGSLASKAYNRVVQRQHRSWIAQEIARPLDSPSR